jgi:peptide/nickel transport system substrate-binding protein
MSDHEFDLTRRAWLAGAGAAAGAGLAARGPLTAFAQGAPKRGGTLRVATVDKPVNMDPGYAQLYSSLQIYQNVYNKLAYVDESGQFIPGLARSWKQENDKTWLFDLVDNAVFHNGEALSAEDVAFTVNRIKKHPLGLFFNSFDKVEVINKHSVRFHLSQPFGPMEATVSYLLDIVNKKAISESDPKAKPIGCGPYRLTEWVRGSHVTLKRWDKYFKSDKPYLDQIRMQTVTSPTLQLTGLKSGQADWIEAVPPNQVPTLLKGNNPAHSPAGPFLPYILNLNNSRPPFNDPRVRQAVSWAINRKEIVDLVFSGSAVASAEAIGPDAPWYSGVDPYKGGPDVDKAKALMRQAGVDSVDVVYIAETDVPAQADIGQVLQAQLKKIGVNVRIQQYANAEWISLRSAHKFDMSVSYFSVSLDAGQTYYLQCLSGSPFNRSASKNPKVDGLVKQVMFEADESVRKAVYSKVVEAAAEDASVIFLLIGDIQYWTTPKIHGAQPLPSLEVRLEDLWRG